MIHAEGLTKDYGARRAIDNLTFSVKNGEVLGLLGPNGAGKTTTMRILAGYMPPTSGTAEIGGFDVTSKSLDVRRITGYMPETVPLYNEMTVSGYLKFIADLRKLKNARAAVNETLEKVNLTSRANGYIGNLSKGMRQRLGIAQAIIHKPEVLIMDEPTIGLDPEQIVEVRNLIREIGREKTVLVSTHLLHEAQQVCNRILIINDGKILIQDAIQHLQQTMSNNRVIKVRTANGIRNIPEKIKYIDGVTDVQLVAEDTLEIISSAKDDPRPEIARVVVEMGLNLLELHGELSLEEIYMALTHPKQEQVGSIETDVAVR